ncbi:hypothetical protein MAPG_01015 [Magnaporthiopsis poae ATCC 64411]|uniref:DNA damage-inducible protein 1 n=1 Tax=Magnaporthiopsis poae (strain ATCC 64411 / 73-15) TaxID=644358 RepID=A0A0C4DMK6_MAGP6|nr:hypothetical protein MAPG_01015 [Magnaporthiopsis poae ATCC 64411]
MRVTISITNPSNMDQDLVSLDIFPDMTLETLRSSIQAEIQIRPTLQHLYHNGVLITDDSKTMEQLQIVDGDMLALHVQDARGASGSSRATGQQAGSGMAGGSGSAGDSSSRGAGGGGGGGAGNAIPQDPEFIRLQILGNPAVRATLTSQQPQLASVLDDPERFAQLYSMSLDRDRRERLERQRQIQQLNEDPFDVEAQTKIEEMIRQERVMENLQNAMEYNPEVFGRVHLLYADVEVNGHKVKAMVDSGAQATIMSPSCAEACGIMRLVDRRFAGMARGVGTAVIIGRVHTAPIKIGSLFLPCSFTVMEGKSVDLLLGLDMLKRYQATIDLSKGKLIIQGEEISFLGEADIPKESEEALEEEPTISGPGGTTIGARSGAVSAPTAAGASEPSSSGPSQPSGSQPQQQSLPGPPPLPKFPEEHIEQLMNLGFSREAVIQALTATGGNLDYAANRLFLG